MNPIATRLLALLVLPTLPLAQQTRRAAMHLEEVADTATPVPGGTGNFSAFLDARDIHGDTVVFSAYDGASRQGLYAHRNDVLQKLVDQNTIVPGTAVTFTIFFDVAVGQDMAVFTAGWPGGTGSGCQFSPNEGLFAIPIGSTTPIVLADSNHTAQSCFQGVDLDRGAIVVTGGSVAVDGFHNHQEAILRWAAPQTLVKLIDTTVPRPTGGFFTGFDQDVSFRDGKLVFGDVVANSIPPLQGVYLQDTALQEIADATTSVPGGTGTFQDLRGLDFDGRRAAFRGVDGAGDTALWVGTGPGDLTAAVERGDPVPGTPFTFLGFSNPVAFSSGSLLFSGFWSGGGYGLFVWNRGLVRKVLRNGDVLDGRVVEQPFAYQGQGQDDDVLVRVIFQGFTERGLYRLRLPYPVPSDG